MIILLHSSKTMKRPTQWSVETTIPVFKSQAEQLMDYLKLLSVSEICKVMKVSDTVAQKTHKFISNWENDAVPTPAVLSFVGDIYSGMQVSTFTSDDFTYAQDHLKILSGLYGILRPLDLIEPYRLEMGYKLPREKFRNLYKFWGEKLVDTLPSEETIINTSSQEYARVITDYVSQDHVITPQFYTISPKTNKPTFVTVHSKIARGSFAAWVIKNRVEKTEDLNNFSELGYKYSSKLSSENQPAFVCKEFGGIGLSVRLR